MVNAAAPINDFLMKSRLEVLFVSFIMDKIHLDMTNACFKSPAIILNVLETPKTQIIFL